MTSIPAAEVRPGTRLSWLWQAPRIFVGAVLIATGTGKWLDIPGFVAIVDAYALLPHGLNLLLGVSLPFVELGCGIALLIWARPRRAAWCAVGLHVLLLTGVVVALSRGRELANCGCFGVFLARPLTWATAAEDAVMLILSLLALWAAYRRPGSEPPRIRHEP